MWGDVCGVCVVCDGVEGGDVMGSREDGAWLAALGIPFLPFHTESDDLPVDP